MTNIRAASLTPIALALFFLSCSGSTTVNLSTDKKELTAGGSEFATITAKAIVAGDPAGAGTTMTFETTAGSFSPSQELTSSTAATDAKGETTIKLYPSKGQATATVTATFYDDTTGLSGTGSISITFGEPTAGQLPVAGTFRMTCDAVNIGALREPAPKIKVTCELAAQTRAGTKISATALQPTFKTEAGTITPEDDTYSGKRVFVYSTAGGASEPKDVQPDPALGEPSHKDGNGRTRNPRDGLATIIAVIDGEESFDDNNGNGKYDQGEPFLDAAEPFVDIDDNDRWDTGEAYIDSNQNGKWDKANAKWDAKTKIMAIYKILWTGPLFKSPQATRIDRLSTTIPDSGKMELTAYAMDINMNPLAGFQGNQDYLEWSLISGGDATSNDATQPPLNNAYGFSFDKQGKDERKRWKILSNSFAVKPFKFTIEDGYPNDGSTVPTNFTVSVTAYVSPGPSGSGYFLPQLTEVFPEKVTGTCD